MIPELIDIAKQGPDIVIASVMCYLVFYLVSSNSKKHDSIKLANEQMTKAMYVQSILVAEILNELQMCYMSLVGLNPEMNDSINERDIKCLPVVKQISSQLERIIRELDKKI